MRRTVPKARDVRQGDGGFVRVGVLECNRATRTVRLKGRMIPFARQEFALLAFLAGNRGKVFTRKMLLEQVWGNEVIVVERTIDVHIRRIRQKLGSEAVLLETVKGSGYRFRG